MNATIIKTFLKTAGIIKTPEQMKAIDQLFSVKWSKPRPVQSNDFTNAATSIHISDNLMLSGTMEGEPITVFVQCPKGKMPAELVALLTGKPE